MSKNLKKHTGYYLSLIAIFLFGVGLMISFTDKRSQMLVVVLMSFLYVELGIMHHFLHHKLTSKIVVEYVLIGALAVSLVFFILKGGLAL